MVFKCQYLEKINGFLLGFCVKSKPYFFSFPVSLIRSRTKVMKNCKFNHILLNSNIKLTFFGFSSGYIILCDIYISLTGKQTPTLVLAV